MAWAALLLGSLFLARIHGGGRQATVLLALLTLTIPGGLLAGLAVAVRKEAGRRLDVGKVPQPGQGADGDVEGTVGTVGELL